MIRASSALSFHPMCSPHLLWGCFQCGCGLISRCFPSSNLQLYLSTDLIPSWSASKVRDAYMELQKDLISMPQQLFHGDVRQSIFFLGSAWISKRKICLSKLIVSRSSHFAFRSFGRESKYTQHSSILTFFGLPCLPSSSKIFYISFFHNDFDTEHSNFEEPLSLE